jgi:hypothetical protein
MQLHSKYHITLSKFNESETPRPIIYVKSSCPEAAEITYFNIWVGALILKANTKAEPFFDVKLGQTGQWDIDIHINFKSGSVKQ